MSRNGFDYVCKQVFDRNGKYLRGFAVSGGVECMCVIPGEAIVVTVTEDIKVSCRRHNLWLSHFCPLRPSGRNGRSQPGGRNGL
jgi:hypothetical protein